MLRIELDELPDHTWRGTVYENGKLIFETRRGTLLGLMMELADRAEREGFK